MGLHSLGKSYAGKWNMEIRPMKKMDVRRTQIYYEVPNFRNGFPPILFVALYCPAVRYILVW